MNMEILLSMVASTITSALGVILILTFLRKQSPKEIKKMEKCPTCKRWQEVK